MPQDAHAGVEHLVDSLAERQAKGNERLAARLASVGDDRLKERLDALADMARTPKRGGES